MAEIDYDPVEAPEDEEERKRRLNDYAPAQARVDVSPEAMAEQKRSVIPRNVAEPDYPAPSLSIAAKNLAPSTVAPPPVGAPKLGPQHPKWSDYAPPESHGWGKFGHFAASLNPITNRFFNVMPQQRAETSYKHATEEYEAPISEAQKEAQTREATATAGEREAQTEALKNPPKEPNLETNPKALTLHYLLTGDNGKPIVNPETGKPYNTIEAFKKVNEAEQEAKPEKQAQPPHVSYDQGIPVSVTADGKTYDINDPKLPPELKPLVDAANRAHGQHSKEEADRQARSFGNAAAMLNKREGAGHEKEVDKQYVTARDADTRLSRMEASYQKGLKGDQQAMLALLTDHIGMTLGLQKGARITKDILNEATASQPWLAKMESKFDDRGYLSGVTLGPEQMKQMLNLGYEARNRQWQRAFEDSQMYGTPEPPGARKVYGGEKNFPQTPAAGGEKIRARDPQGVLHEAPAGSALPPGWKMEK